MVVKVSNKDIHRYSYTKRKIHLRRRKRKKSKISFGEVFANIQALKEKGVISVESVAISISKAIIKMK